MSEEGYPECLEYNEPTPSRVRMDRWDTDERGWGGFFAEKVCKTARFWAGFKLSKMSFANQSVDMSC